MSIKGKFPYTPHPSVTPAVVRSVFGLIQSINDESTNESIARSIAEFGLSTELLRLTAKSFTRFVDEYTAQRLSTGDTVVLNDELVLSLRTEYRLRTRGKCYIPVYELMGQVIKNELNRQNSLLTWSIVMDYSNYAMQASASLTQYVGVESFMIRR
jgi:hypothetical protein